MNPEFLDHRLTEQRNPATAGIDVASSVEIVDQLHIEDATVADAVYRALQNKLWRYQTAIKEMAAGQGDDLPPDMQRRKEYVTLMENVGVL